MSGCTYEKRLFCPAFLLALLDGDCCPDCGADTDEGSDEDEENASGR